MNKTNIEGYFSVQESPQEIILKRKWRNWWLYIIPLLLGVFLDFIWLRKVSDIIENDNSFVAYGFIPTAIFLTYLGLCGVFNAITIRINGESIEKKSQPLPWLGNVKILTKDFIAAREIPIIHIQRTKVVRSGGTNITVSLPEPIKSTTGYNVVLEVDAIVKGEASSKDIDFQVFTIGSYKASEFLVLCLNKFSRK